MFPLNLPLTLAQFGEDTDHAKTLFSVFCKELIWSRTVPRIQTVLFIAKLPAQLLCHQYPEADFFNHTKLLLRGRKSWESLC